ncbi:hypothetical protein ABZY16_39410, partial [Streptomyces sp. NPDC006553]|uniref:hypothetical protein n=1 Tax=Streptomyces sp. NPDC006553 TaxID=3157180 RepID=UPI0033B0F61B
RLGSLQEASSVWSEAVSKLEKSKDKAETGLKDTGGGTGAAGEADTGGGTRAAGAAHPAAMGDAVVVDAASEAPRLRLDRA